MPFDCAIPRVVLIGDGPTALSALRSLISSSDVIAVFRAEAEDDPVRALAAQHQIAVRDVGGLVDLGKLIEASRPDVVVISSFNRILPPDILTLARFVNVHYSPLPEYRGRANVNWALINGEREAAISIHCIEPGLDEGNILFQQRIEISPHDTAQSLYARLNDIQERHLGDAVHRAVAGDAGVAQRHELASYGCARIVDDGEIDWSKSTIQIDRLIRALSSHNLPGAFTHLDCQRLVIAEAKPQSEAPRFAGRVPGRVVGRSIREGWVDVLTGDGVLRIFRVVPSEGTSTPAATLIPSTRSSLGLSRQSLLRYVEALERRIARLEEETSETTRRSEGSQSRKAS